MSSEFNEIFARTAKKVALSYMEDIDFVVRKSEGIKYYEVKIEIAHPRPSRVYNFVTPDKTTGYMYLICLNNGYDIENVVSIPDESKEIIMNHQINRLPGFKGFVDSMFGVVDASELPYDIKFNYLSNIISNIHDFKKPEGVKPEEVVL